jgi:hypothetical protein
MIYRESRKDYESNFTLSSNLNLITMHIIQAKDDAHERTRTRTRHDSPSPPPQIQRMPAHHALPAGPGPVAPANRRVLLSRLCFLAPLITFRSGPSVDVQNYLAAAEENTPKGARKRHARGLEQKIG